MERLSNELLAEIFSYLLRSDMRTVGLVSTRFWAVCNPILYHTVDFLSPGNRGTELHIHVLERQILWTKQILANPNLGLLVKSFSWTILYTIDRGTRWSQSFVEGRRAMFDMFRLISSAIQCRIEAFPHLSIDDRNPPRNLRDLFPQARDITLKGDIPLVLALAILHGSAKPDLTYLTLEDISEPAGYHFCTIADISTRELQSRCRSLKVLKIRKEGRFQYHRSISWCGTGLPAPGWVSSIEIADQIEYQQVARIIQLLAPEHVIFAYGKQADRYSEWYEPNHIEEGLRLGNCPKDIYFRQYIEPILLTGWPTLKSLDIRGVSEEFTANLRSLPIQVATTEEWERE